MRTCDKAWHTPCSAGSALMVSIADRAALQVAHCVVAAAFIIGGFASDAQAQPSPMFSSSPDPVAATGGDGAALVRPDQARGLAEEPGVEPEDVALFVPRAILFVPARVIGFISFPIREALRFIEKHHVIERVEDVLYNDERTAAILPVISLSTFMGAQIGVRAFHNNLGGHGEAGSVKASFGVDRTQLYVVSFKATHVGGTPFWIESTSAFEEHPALTFYGLGGDGEVDAPGSNLDPRAASVKSFYAQQRFRQLLTVGASLGEPGGFEARLGVRGRFKHHNFDEPRGIKPEERALDAAYDTSLVPGYDLGATVAETEAVAVVMARDKTHASGHALYAEAFGGGAPPIRQFEYGHFGAEVTGYIDLYHGDRLLVLRTAFQAMMGAEGAIPFVELPSLGGSHRLRGYPQHRFTDEKLLLATVEYQYPIHELLAGTFFVDAGKVSRDFEGIFTDPNIHVGGGGGIVIRNKSRVYLSAEVAGGEGVQVILTSDPLRAFADRDDEL